MGRHATADSVWSLQAENVKAAGYKDVTGRSASVILITGNVFCFSLTQVRSLPLLPPLMLCHVLMHLHEQQKVQLN